MENYTKKKKHEKRILEQLEHVLPVDSETLGVI